MSTGKQGPNVAEGVAELRTLLETHAPGACPRCGEALAAPRDLATRSLRVAARIAKVRADLRPRDPVAATLGNAALELIALAEALLHSEGACRRQPVAFGEAARSDSTGR